MDMYSSSAFQLVPEFSSLPTFQAVIDFNAHKCDKADYLELINYIHCMITKRHDLYILYPSHYLAPWREVSVLIDSLINPRIKYMTISLFF